MLPPNVTYAHSALYASSAEIRPNTDRVTLLPQVVPPSPAPRTLVVGGDKPTPPSPLPARRR